MAEASIYEQLEGSDFVRVWIPSYNSGGWIIEKYGDLYLVWLDIPSDRPVYVLEVVSECDLD